MTDDKAVFLSALPDGGRLLGLDIGTKTVGLALCDAQWTFATAAETIERRKFSKDLERITAVIAEQNIVGLVAGLPLNLDGSMSKQTQAAKAFAQNLKPLGLPILLWDERWSTQAVERDLIASDVTRKKRGKVIDKMAAAYILQGAIDGLAASG
ncbi:Holliday junction resolvase RuvX [Parasphingorhabdus halotolerans]|uniref:Putative pre-16S rRNA nuclease n=1 Tax=Parasphingorhabdus halotolerans TaxID=2725558 RepID=A0A6H2DJ58_9SPHN|nr:Holliday junction resolvase RuvX [Parasphingorhabdus halotolerans]QJB68364.1 Holliday junction resolvase RuvX [Parasphingorhabdus halotolerans]